MKKETKKELLSLILENDLEETPCKDEPKEIGGEIRIVILQRGWVFVGKYFEKGTDCRLEDANCIRAWGTTKGLGELAEEGTKTNTKLDPCPTVQFHKLTVVAMITCNQEKWKKIL